MSQKINNLINEKNKLKKDLSIANQMRKTINTVKTYSNYVENDKKRLLKNIQGAIDGNREVQYLEKSKGYHKYNETQIESILKEIDGMIRTINNKISDSDKKIATEKKAEEAKNKK
ncbi:MAG: hypothetical protein ACRDDY_16825 [Clostridium sp.]|uniref:hypothetical protein n=1 Tax=Clostridium sp. TaxID=1506 RepID=UPI003EE60459